MYVTYRPPANEDEEPEEQRWAFIPDEVNSFDAEAVESITGWTFDEFLYNVQKGSMKARRALLWILLRNIHRGIQFRDIQISKKILEVEYDKAEYADMIKNIEEAPEQPGINKEAVLDNFRAEMAKAPEPPAESGKAHYGSAAGLIPMPSHKSVSTQ